MGGGSSSPAGVPPADHVPQRKQTATRAENPLQRHIIGGLQEQDDFRSKLEKILRSRDDRRIFEMYLRDEYCHEMLLFWKAAQVYQGHALKYASMKRGMSSNPNERLDQMKLQHPHILKVAKLVFDRHVHPSGPEAVTLSGKMVREITKQIKSGVVTTELFFDAAKEVQKLMAVDKLPRFSAWIRTDAALKKLEEILALDDDGFVVKSEDVDSQITSIEGVSPCPSIISSSFSPRASKENILEAHGSDAECRLIESRTIGRRKSSKKIIGPLNLGPDKDPDRPALREVDACAERSNSDAGLPTTGHPAGESPTTGDPVEPPQTNGAVETPATGAPKPVTTAPAPATEPSS